MRPLSISVFAALIQLAVFASTSPIIEDRSLSLSPRTGEACANFPGVSAGTFVGPTATNIANPSWNIADMLRHIIVPRRGEIQRWCAPNSATYVILRVTNAVVSAFMSSTIAQVYQTVSRHIAFNGDGLIGGGGYRAQAHSGLVVRVMNANNHQITWGVFGSALLALASYMITSGSGAVAFLVYDGENGVGQGAIY